MNANVPSSSVSDLILTAAANRSCDRQWRPFIEALATALPAAVGDETSLAILDRIGRDIARSRPLPPCASLAELQSAVNKGMEVLDWGQAHLREEGRHLEIVVIGYPHLQTVDGQAVFAATLEAVLDEWLTSQASRRDLGVRLKASGGGVYPPLVYHYGRVDGG